MALAQRADMLVANEAARGTLEKNGLVFNDVDREEFRAVLRKSGFYSEWQERYGKEPWAALERNSGALG
jgi:TRAP-type transport system periplasmic protein